MSYRQSVTPDRLQGRMNATMRSLNRAVVVVGAPLGGHFADAVGLRPALWLGAAGVAAAGVLLAASGFRTAGHDDQPPLVQPVVAIDPNWQRRVGRARDSTSALDLRK